MSLTFRQLEVLHAVSRAGSVSGAAAALGVSQPAVSMLLRECARIAGFEFFIKRQARLHPTSEMQGLLADLERVVNGVDRIDHLIEDMRVTTAGSIHIAATPTLANSLLPRAITRFQKTRPNVRIAIQAMDNVSVVDQVAGDHVDLGLALSPVARGDLRQIELCRSELVCVVRADNPLAGQTGITPQELAEQPLISFRKSLPLGVLVNDAFKKAGLAQRISLEVNQSSLACALARSGAGVAIIDPFWLVDNQEQALVRLALRPAVEVVAQALVSRKTNLSRPARQLLTAIREAAVELERSGEI